MNIGPFDFDRPFVEDSQGPLGVDRPLVQPERASYLEHHVSRDSAAEVAYEYHLREKWARMRLEELNDRLEDARARRNRLEKRYDNTPLAMQQDRIADKIYRVDEEIEEINKEIDAIQSGEKEPSRHFGAGNPEKFSIYEIEEGLPVVLHEEIEDLGITEQPTVQAKAREAVILTKVSNVTMDTAHQIQNRYEDIGLMVNEVKFR